MVTWHLEMKWKNSISRVKVMIIKLEKIDPESAENIHPNNTEELSVHWKSIKLRENDE